MYADMIRTTIEPAANTLWRRGVARWSCNHPQLSSWTQLVKRTSSTMFLMISSMLICQMCGNWKPGLLSRRKLRRKSLQTRKLSGKSIPKLERYECWQVSPHHSDVFHYMRFQSVIANDGEKTRPPDYILSIVLYSSWFLWFLLL